MFVEDVPITAFYNESLRELVVAAKKIANVKCQPKIDLDKTDGFTDTSPVSIILLNELYNFLVTCSVSSTIVIWDVWKGRKVNFISRAHTRIKNGEVQLVEITAACFDPKHQFLLTAGDDTLKVWNFNEGICLRTIKVGDACRVTEVFWTSHRFFAIGRGVTEFQDSNDYKEQINLGKTWPEYHRGNIVCASARDPDAIVTSCTGGDLIFWRFKTGQPYLRFNFEQVGNNNKIHKMKNETLPEGSLNGTEKMKKNMAFKALEDRFESP